jgi:bifunctional UDP-N-acetylglucosamine pyrophosphorylase/glucosamine-1-phosphate N-acetyltransferase
MSLHVIVLAAGQGTRMKSRLPKVLQPLGGRTLLAHVLDTAQSLSPAGIHVVHGHGAEEVRSRLASFDVRWVLQAEQLGTAHAVRQAIGGIPDPATVLVLYGDVPLVTLSTLRTLAAAAGSGELGLLTVELADPRGYGRILRDSRGEVNAIIEEKDASESQRQLRETNTGLLACNAKSLRGWLERVGNDNAQGEYYLTDIVALAVQDGVRVRAVRAESAQEVMGINDKTQLAEAERALQLRQARRLMADGLTLKDPARFDLRGELSIGRDVTIDVNVVIEGRVTLADGVSIGPNCWLRDCEIGPGSEVLPNSVLDGVRLGAGCHVGPFARLRPGTELADGARVGNFVEVKQARVGAGSKINHLSYVGDAEIGRDVNVGAGVITCNYDGASKHRTVIGDGAFIGSDSQLVAPVEVGADATIGAGSTITRNAPPGKLTVSRVRQATLDGWKRPAKKPNNKPK